MQTGICSAIMIGANKEGFETYLKNVNRTPTHTHTLTRTHILRSIILLTFIENEN